MTFQHVFHKIGKFTEIITYICKRSQRYMVLNCIFIMPLDMYWNRLKNR